MKTYRKKIFYLPGLISLLLLPLLGGLYLQNEFQKRNYRTIEINWWHPSWKENYRNQNYYYEIYPNRNYTTISLSQENLEKEKQLLEFRKQLKKLVSTKDTFDGLHIKFNKKSSFGDLVAVINILLKEKAKMYVLKDYDVWVFNFIPKEIKNTTFTFEKPCGGTRDMICQVFPMAQESNFLNGIISPEFNQELNPILKVWPVFILLLVIVGMTLKNNRYKRINKL